MNGTKNSLDVTFIKENLSQTELLMSIGYSALKALITSAVLIGSVVSVQNANTVAESIRSYVYISIVTGFILSLFFGIQYYYGKLHRMYDVVYTSSIESDCNRIDLIARVGLAVILSLGLGAAMLLSQQYSTEMMSAGACSIASTLFLYYIFRKKLVDLKAYFVYAGYGILTGTSAYMLGSLIIIAIGLIGLWMTVGILVLETIFTAIYTYIGLLEWVEKEKKRRVSQKQYEQERAERDEAAEILHRMA